MRWCCGDDDYWSRRARAGRHGHDGCHDTRSLIAAAERRRGERILGFASGRAVAAATVEAVMDTEGHVEHFLVEGQMSRFRASVCCAYWSGAR